MARYTEGQIFRISPKTFNEIDAWIRDAERAGRNARFGIEALVSLMARTNQAIAMQMSAGPLDPRMRNRGAAWKIPVRRITSRYYQGWKVKRLAAGVWMLYNDSREAYFIEFGIHPTGSQDTSAGGTPFVRRVRRPIRKLSLIRTMRFMDQSRAGERVWEMIFAPFDPRRRHRSDRTNIIRDQVQVQRGMRFI